MVHKKITLALGLLIFSTQHIQAGIAATMARLVILVAASGGSFYAGAELAREVKDESCKKALKRQRNYYEDQQAALEEKHSYTQQQLKECESSRKMTREMLYKLIHSEDQTRS